MFQTQQVSGNGTPTISASQLKVPGKAQRALEKAWKAFKKRNLVEMASQVDRALALYPRYAEALVFRAAMEIESGSVDKARADAEAAVAYDPNCAIAYLFLGSAYNRLKQADDAIRSLDRALLLDPHNGWNYYEMGRARFLKGDYTGALRYADKALSFSNKDDLASLSHLLKAAAYVGLEDRSSSDVELHHIQESADPKILASKRVIEQINASAEAK